MKNVTYNSSELLKKYCKERNSWEELYESERYIFDKVFAKIDSPVTILDAGCACGGLATAIQNKVSISKYVGIDICNEMIQYAKKRRDICINHEFICADVSSPAINDQFDIVVSLSCVDWNEDIYGMINSCWSLVKPGGVFISSFRLTNEESILHGGYQVLGGSEEDDLERYNYVVFNYKDWTQIVSGLCPSATNVNLFGYWGTPSATAVIPYDRLCFSVAAIYKQSTTWHELNNQSICASLPLDLLVR